jgi:ribosome-associated translation inhibitor RaiA
MQVLFESRDPAGAPLRGLAERRVRFVMRRLTWLVPRVRVQLSDTNGPRGGVDKRCQVDLKTHGGSQLVITSIDRDWRSALDQALARAARALLRMWRRAQAHRAPHAAGLRQRPLAHD